MTAYHMMRRADVGAGDLVLVPGATGGVGVAAIQLLDAVGARSVGTSTSERKLAELEARGVDHTIHSADVDEIADEMRAIHTADAMLNHLVGAYTQLGLETVKCGGTVAICGRTADGRSTIDLQQFFLGPQEVVGSTMGTQPELSTLVELLADDAFDPPVEDTYPLADAGDAFDAMIERDAFGKLIVEPSA